MENDDNPKHDTRFQPGQSGNPAGKKPGTRNRSTMLVEQMIGDEAERIAGNSSAARSRASPGRSRPA